jgi:hypothetical protein
MPDVVIWMISGSDRVAYYRIPAYDLLYNENPEYSGKFCKKVLDLELKVNFKVTKRSVQASDIENWNINSAFLEKGLTVS